ncbi:hypothetical protein BN3590_01532 [Clostridium sp. C105KSO15]|nr:hypothetical protein BN3590_01532 [Clostridium sp. C105KSO15]
MASTDKNTRVLSLYHQLLTGIKVRKQTFCLENGINERSFDRDIEDVRLFLSEMQPYCELIYDRIDKIYYLSHTVGSMLSGEESLFFLNVLLAQKNVRSDELIGMLRNLINNTDSSRRNEVCKYLEMKLKFTKKVTNNAILKMHWDMERAIYNCRLIEIEYKLEDQKYVMRRVSPVELHFEGGHIYLIAYIVEKTYNSPAFYRLDRIRSFKIINSKYPEIMKEEHLNKDIHSNRYSMLAGEEITVTVKVECIMKKVIDDLFPEHRVVDSNKDSTVFEIRTYKQGFISWLLGQSEKVEVIEPVTLRQELLIKIQELQKIYSGKGVE